ncbi:MAG TPA: DUF2510 domain-containing protein [Actinomycetota bacterium]|nr:DUF2510 domain-containing protein [Actinomycetota bacterium]
MSDYPEGWYDDPDRFGAERYWDGKAWTDERRFVTRLDEFLQPTRHRKDDHRVVVTGEHLSCDDDTIKWDEMTGFDAVNKLDVNRRPFIYSVTINRGGDEFTLDFPATLDKDGRIANTFVTIIDQAQRILLPRLAHELLRKVDAGEAIEFEGVAVSPRGFSKAKKNDDPVPWAEYGGWRMQEAVFFLDRMKGGKAKKAVRVDTTQLGRWILPPLVEDHARRYSQAENSQLVDG